MSRTAALRAPAKINLALHVLHRRSDGFHELETLFQAVELYDDVRVSVGGEGITLEVEGAELGPPERNLAYRAARRLCDSADIDVGVQISLTKRIPVGAGLGGGSSDAAAVLRCLACVFELATEAPDLRRVADEIGSDVSFFLGASPLAVGRGRGELLDPAPPLPRAPLVLVSPPVHVSTAWAYGELAEHRRRSREPAGVRLAEAPSGWEDVITVAHNDLQAIVEARHPEVRRASAALREAGARTALMSGSGSTSFGLFADAGAARAAAEELAHELGWPCRAVPTLSAFPLPALG